MSSAHCDSTHFDAADAAEDRARLRREERAIARGEDPEKLVDRDTTARVQAVAAAKGRPSPTPPAGPAARPRPPAGPPAVLEHPGRPAASVAAKEPTRLFTPVAEVPGKRDLVPEPRQELIEYAITHPGQWLRYEPGKRDSAASTLYSLARKHQGGFVKGFEVKLRARVAYVRYVPAKDES